MDVPKRFHSFKTTKTMPSCFCSHLFNLSSSKSSNCAHITVYMFVYLVVSASSKLRRSYPPKTLHEPWAAKTLPDFSLEISSGFWNIHHSPRPSTVRRNVEKTSHGLHFMLFPGIFLPCRGQNVEPPPPQHFCWLKPLLSIFPSCKAHIAHRVFLLQHLGIGGGHGHLSLGHGSKSTSARHSQSLPHTRHTSSKPPGCETCEGSNTSWSYGTSCHTGWCRQELVHHRFHLQDHQPQDLPIH